MRHRSMFGAALAAVAAVAMMMTGAPAMAVDASPSYAGNQEFAKGLKEYASNAKRRGFKVGAINDLGVKVLKNGETATYTPTGSLARDEQTASGGKLGLDVQTYEVKVAPGQQVKFTIGVKNEASQGGITLGGGASLSAKMTTTRFLVSYHGWDGDLIHADGASAGGNFTTYSSSRDGMTFSQWVVSTKDVDGYAQFPADFFLLSQGVGCASDACTKTVDDDDVTWMASDPNTTGKTQTVRISVASGDPIARGAKISTKASVTQSFTDVTDKTPHHGDIAWLAAQGIAQGFVDRKTGTVTFGGMRDVVRQDMAAFLYRLAGSPEFDAAAALRKNPFKDVTDKTPHYKEILWLASTGIAKGYRDGTFGGGRMVVRQDMAAFLRGYAGWAKADPKLGAAKSFKDVTDRTPHHGDIAWLARTGVTEGYKDGTFGGMRTVVRQDMAAFLHRMDQNVLR